MSDRDRPLRSRDPTRTSGKEAAGGSDPPEASASRQRLGDFEILRQLGRGGMGVVYEARQLSLDRRVALKVLPPGLGLTEQAVRRFEREAKAAAKLHHTNIVPVHAIGQSEGSHFYAMELIEGQPLSEVLRDLSDAGSNPLMDETVAKLGGADPAASKPEASQADSGITSLSDTQAGSRKWFHVVVKLLAEVADALEYAHDRGVIHRDIKPANLMLSKEGRLCLTDFGLARVAQEPGMTISGSLLGTPAYMSPEQIAVGRVKLDHRTDVYSLGAVLYELLAHRRPFPGESREEVLSAILTKDPRPPRRFNPRIPLDLQTICLKAMEKDPDRRYASAGEMAHDLRQYLQGGLIKARRASLPRRARKSMRRHPVVTTVTAAVLVVCLLVGFGWQALRQADAPRLVAEANLALERGDYSAGLEAAERALELQPDHPEARIVRARLLLQLGRTDEMIAEARFLLEGNPDDWTAHFILAFVSKAWNRPSIPAAEHVLALEQLAPESADVFYRRGLMAKSASEAVAHYTRALELNPAHTWALLARAGRYGELKDFDARKADAERMLAIRPRSPRGRLMLGAYYKEQLDYDRALAEYGKAIELDPEDPNSYAERGTVYRDMGRDEDAVADFTRAIEIGPPLGGFYRLRAIAYSWELASYEEAIADARRALELNPDDRWAFFELLAVYRILDRMDEFERTADELRTRAAGWFDPEARADAYTNVSKEIRFTRTKYEQALEEANRAVEADPNNLEARIERIRVLRALNDDAAFEAECDALAALELKDPEPLKTRADNLGWACGRLEQAVEHFDPLIADHPGWYELYYIRGTMYIDMHRHEHSLADLTRAIELNPFHWQAYHNRSLAFRRLHRYEEERADLDKALELGQPHPFILVKRAAVAERLGQLDEAIRFYDRVLEVTPTSVVAHTGRASILAVWGRCDEAMEELRVIEGRLRPIQKSSVANVHTRDLHSHCPDDYDAAKALAYATESAAAPKLESSPEFLVNLGFALYRNGHYREAREALLKADAAARADGEQLFFLAMSSWQLGEKKDARSYYDQGLAWMNEHSPDDPSLIALRDEAFLLLGIPDPG